MPKRVSIEVVPEQTRGRWMPVWKAVEALIAEGAVGEAVVEEVKDDKEARSLASGVTRFKGEDGKNPIRVSRDGLKVYFALRDSEADGEEDEGEDEA